MVQAQNHKRFTKPQKPYRDCSQSTVSTASKKPHLPDNGSAARSFFCRNRLWIRQFSRIEGMRWLALSERLRILDPQLGKMFKQDPLHRQHGTRVPVDVDVILLDDFFGVHIVQVCTLVFHDSVTPSSSPA